MALCLGAGLGGCLNADTCACLAGLDEYGMDFVNSGCAMKKTVSQQNTKIGREASKCDHVIWEIEVPKVSNCWPAPASCPALHSHLLALPVLHWLGAVPGTSTTDEGLSD